MIYGRRPPTYETTKAQTVAVRRALRGLASDGLIIGPQRLGDYPERFWRFNVAR
jgi:hypothetical protein